MKVKFAGIDCDVRFGQYSNGNTAIQLIGSEGTDYEGEAVAIASVNGGLKVEPAVVGIKTWSENAGIVQALVEGGVIESELLFTQPSGFVEIEYYRLTDEAFKQMLQDFEQTVSYRLSICSTLQSRG